MEEDHAKAEKIIMKFVKDNGGVVSPKDVTTLYHGEPWLADKVVRLQTFCGRSSNLLYTPRRGRNKAQIAIITPKVPEAKSAMSGEPDTALPPQPYRRNRKDRRDAQQHWLDEFLGAFCPELIEYSRVFMSAIRLYPGNDEDVTVKKPGAPTEGKKRRKRKSKPTDAPHTHTKGMTRSSATSGRISTRSLSLVIPLKLVSHMHAPHPVQ